MRRPVQVSLRGEEPGTPASGAGAAPAGALGAGAPSGGPPPASAQTAQRGARSQALRQTIQSLQLASGLGELVGRGLQGEAEVSPSGTSLPGLTATRPEGQAVLS